MKRMLFILTEDPMNGVIQSQVLTHIKYLKQNKIINASILFCYWNNEMFKFLQSSEKFIKKNYSIRIDSLKILPPSIIFSNFLNKRTICKYYKKKKKNIQYIHARTDLCAVLSENLKNCSDSKLIWDCRGYAPAELDYEKKKFNFLRKFFLISRFKRACKISDKVIAVSNYLKQKIKKNGNLNTYLIPSVASKKIFYFNEKVRQQVRNRLGIGKRSIVFIYSGSLKKYQMFDETLSFFKNFNKKKKSYLIILSNELSSAKQKIKNYENIFLFSVDHKKVNDYLNAADYAIMIRKKDQTNNAASPTKFAEYCLTGLEVVTNSAVTDYYSLAKDINNVHNIASFRPNFITKANRKKIAEIYKKKISREAYKKIYEEIYK